ncbi:MAG: hypothetical protein OHK93_003826 [Ramalina farinacea]|uniref:Uncharacterized protein n=1 Tax=Ramalina farinacea TaxID=258253 RepID=A0AA43QFK1_9LECA|nr:hypothetical protein [Ramalina farinacea]
MVFSPLGTYVIRSQSEPTTPDYDHDVWTAPYPTVWTAPYTPLKPFSPILSDAIRQNPKPVQPTKASTTSAVPPEPGQFERRLQQILLQPQATELAQRLHQIPLQSQPTQLALRPKTETLPLPLELRIQIYNHLFSTSYTALWHPASQRKPLLPRPSPSTNILLVSSTTHFEASQISIPHPGPSTSTSSPTPACPVGST